MTLCGEKDEKPQPKPETTSAFYSEWFIRRLTEGFVRVKTPTQVIYHISLKSQDLLDSLLVKDFHRSLKGFRRWKSHLSSSISLSPGFKDANKTPQRQSRR
jgi:hypothetical protein